MNNVKLDLLGGRTFAKEIQSLSESRMSLAISNRLTACRDGFKERSLARAMPEVTLLLNELRRKHLIIVLFGMIVYN
jgi:hypothetical protein